MALAAKFCAILLLLIFSAKFCTSQGEEDFEECSTKKSVLLKALYSTSDNQYELERAFAPPKPGVTTSRYIKAIYSFADEDGHYGDCNVKYTWAIGGFFLIQPPQIFELTSLLFSIPGSNRSSITLKLPYHCRGLINSTSNSSVTGDDACTCYSAGDPMSEPLLVFTNQLKQYTKFVDPVNVVQDITSHAKSVCDENLEDTKFIDSDEVRMFFSMAILIPIITMMVLVLIVRSTHKHIHTRITGTSEKGYQNLVGLTLAGITVMMYILCMDMAAVHYYRVEYSEKSLGNTINLFSPAITLILDLMVSIPCLTLMIYLSSVQLSCLCLRHTHEYPCLSKVVTLLNVRSYTKMFIALYFYVIFGSKTGSMLRDLQSLRQSAEVQKVINVWVLTGVAVAPFLCVSSHAGYILMAWVTDPVRTTAVFLIALECCLYLFFMFRQCYTVHAENNDEGNTPYVESNSDYTLITIKGPAEETDYGSIQVRRSYMNIEAKWYCQAIAVFLQIPLLLFLAIVCVVPAQFAITAYVIVQGLVKAYRTHRRENMSSADFCKQLKPDNTIITDLSYKGMMIAFGMSWLIIAPLALIISSFFLLPVSTFLLAQYLQSTSQILTVVIGLLISYKIFTRPESDFEVFMRAFHKKAKINKENGNISEERALQETPRKQAQEDPRQLGASIHITAQEGALPTPMSQLESSEEKYDNVAEAGGAIAGELAGKLISYFDIQLQEDNDNEQNRTRKTRTRKIKTRKIRMRNKRKNETRTLTSTRSNFEVEIHFESETHA